MNPSALCTTKGYYEQKITLQDCPQKMRLQRRPETIKIKQSQGQNKYSALNIFFLKLIT